MPTPAAASFERLACLFIAARRRRGYARSAEATVALHLRRLFRYLRRRGLRDAREVAKAHLVSFARSLQTAASQRGGPLSVSFQAGCLDRARGFFAFLESRGIILQSPARSLFVPREQRLPRCTLSAEGAARLLSQPSAITVIGKRDRALLELLYGTALRASECCRLDLSDVSLAQGTLLVRDGKGRRDRLVPLIGQAARALDLYLREARPRLAASPAETAVFVSWQKRRLTVTGLEIAVARHARGAGLDVHPHSLRHACATHLLRGGASVRHVQELLGHSSINTTMLYTRVEISDLARVVARSHPRERWREKMGQ